jgi:hypothetical protein
MWITHLDARYFRRPILLFVAATVVHVSAAPPPARPSTPGECPSSSSGVLRLYVINEAGASRQTLAAASTEAGAIWATAGLRLIWTLHPAPVDLTDNRTVAVVVRRAMRRPSTVSAGHAKGPAAPLLGRVPFGDDGRPGNLIEVSFEAITSLVLGSSYMNGPVAKLPDYMQQVLLGRGLGRVMAHEIGHWLVGHGHMQEGLMKPAFSDRDLVEWNFPRLPRAWTAMGTEMLMAQFSRCEPTPGAD